MKGNSWLMQENSYYHTFSLHSKILQLLTLKPETAQEFIKKKMRIAGVEKKTNNKTLELQKVSEA